MNRAEIRVLAMHQADEHLPYGIKCLCGAELSDLNPDPTDASVTGRGLAMAIHQAQEIEEMPGIGTGDVLRSTEAVMRYEQETARLAIEALAAARQDKKAS